MLQEIREKMQGVIAWGIVVIIIVVFSLWGINYYSSSFGGSGVAAKVDGVKITWREIESIAEQEKRHIAETDPRALSQIDSDMLRAQVRQYLIQQLALDSQIKKSGFTISKKQLAKRISSESAFQEDGKFSENKYKQFLHRISETETRFAERIKSGMLLEQIRHALVMSSFVFDTEVKNIMELFMQQRDFGYAIIPTSRFSQGIYIQQEEINKYFQQHQSTFVEPEKVKINYIELTLDELAKSINVTEENLKEYYKKHEALYTTPEEVEVSHILIGAPAGSDVDKSGEAKGKIDDILARIKLGENFEDLAKKYSEDQISGANGGKLGKIGRGQTVKEFEVAAFDLSKPDEVSEVVKTEYGYHIIKLLKKHESYLQPYEEIHDLLVDSYKKELAESQFTDKCEELANLAFEYPDSLQRAAEKMSLPIKETKFFSREGNDNFDSITSIPGVIEAAFNPEIIGKTKNSDLIKIDDERYAVIRVKDHTPVRSLTLEEVQGQIKDILVGQYAKKEAEKLGNSLLSKLKEGNTPYALAKENHFEWNVEKNIDRNNTTINSYIMKRVFALPQPDKKGPPIDVGFTLPTGDYVILSLQSVKDNPIVSDENLARQFKKKLEMTLAQIQIQLYEMSLIDKAKIKIEY